MTLYGNREAGDDGGGGEKCPAGYYSACLVGLFDVGYQPGFKSGDYPQHKVVLVWEVDVRDSKGRRFTILDPVAAWLSTKPSKFSDRIGALIGRPLTEKECTDGVDDSLFRGKTAKVLVVPPGGNGKWPKIDRALPLPPSERPMDSAVITEANWPKHVQSAVTKSRERAVPAGKPATKSAPASAAPVQNEPGESSPF